MPGKKRNFTPQFGGETAAAPDEPRNTPNTRKPENRRRDEFHESQTFLFAYFEYFAVENQ
jgi:hypothetical protein